MIHYCTRCGDEFAPVEYREVPAGEEEFCSDYCEDQWMELDRNASDYELSRRGGAPVF